MALKRSHDVRRVFTGESFGYITASLRSFHVDCFRIGSQDCLREPFRLFMEKQERQNKKGSYVSDSKKSGINFVYFCSVIKALRLAWIGRLLSTSDDKWKAIPNYYFRKHGSLLFLLKCNYDIKLLKTGLPLFYREVLQYFQDLKSATNIFQNGEFIVWNNKSITIDNATLFWKPW